MTKYGNTHRSFFDATLDKFGRLRVDSERARAVDHAIVFDRLRKLRDRLGCFVRQDSHLGSHVVYVG